MKKKLKSKWTIVFIVFVLSFAIIDSNIQKNSSVEDTETNNKYNQMITP